MIMATKRLALELGLVQKRQLKSSITTKIPKAKQEFDYIVVLDFESTCWENGPRVGGQEIIEFPAVLLDLSKGKIVSEFQQYVMPTEQPVLSAFCTNLTGITQEQVDAGIPLGACLYMFSNWIKKLSEEHQVSFNTNMPGKHATFATWSDWDLGVCLQYECQRKNLRKPEYFNQWIDIRATYKNFYQRRPQGLAGALKDLGISFEGREHSGICDTRNTATLISRMVRDGCVLTNTKSIAPKSKGLSMKTAAQKFFNQVATIGKRKSNEAHNNNETKRRQKNDLETKSHHDLAVYQRETNFEPPQQKVENSLIAHKTKSPIIADSVSFDLGFQDIMCDGGREFGHVEASESVVNNRNETFLNETDQGPSTSCGTFKIPNLALCKLKNIFSSKSKDLSTSKADTSTPKLLNYTTVKTPQTINSANNSLFNDTVSNIQSFKKTPPLCDCGRRAKLLMASKPGPNQGRHFYACPNGKVNFKRCCKFFKWEDEPYIKASPKTGNFMTPAGSLNGHLVAKSVPPNRSIQKQKTLGVRRAFSEATYNKRSNPYSKTHMGTEMHVNSVTTGPGSSSSNTTNGSLQITPYIVKSKQICNLQNGN